MNRNIAAPFEVLLAMHIVHMLYRAALSIINADEDVIMVTASAAHGHWLQDTCCTQCAAEVNLTFGRKIDAIVLWLNGRAPDS